MKLFDSSCNSKPNPDFGQVMLESFKVLKRAVMDGMGFQDYGQHRMKAITFVSVYDIWHY